MSPLRKAALTLIAIATLAAAPSAIARVYCRASDKACIALHRPSTHAERAQTRELNRESRDTAQAPIANRQNYYAADNAADSYARDQQDYRRAMQDYRREQRRYEEALRRDRYRPAPRLSGSDRDACRALATAPRPGPGMSWSEEAWAEDHDAYAPTGGKVDGSIAAPAPGLSGSTTGLTAFNARASGLERNCAPPRRAFDRYR
jgi:hypothetical protein